MSLGFVRSVTAFVALGVSATSSANPWLCHHAMAGFNSRSPDRTQLQAALVGINSSLPKSVSLTLAEVPFPNERKVRVALIAASHAYDLGKAGELLFPLLEANRAFEFGNAKDTPRVMVPLMPPIDDKADRYLAILQKGYIALYTTAGALFGGLVFQQIAGDQPEINLGTVIGAVGLGAASTIGLNKFFWPRGIPLTYLDAKAVERVVKDVIKAEQNAMENPDWQTAPYGKGGESLIVVTYLRDYVTSGRRWLSRTAKLETDVEFTRRILSSGPFQVIFSRQPEEVAP